MSLVNKSWPSLKSHHSNLMTRLKATLNGSKLLLFAMLCIGLFWPCGMCTGKILLELNTKRSQVQLISQFRGVFIQFVFLRGK